MAGARVRARSRRRPRRPSPGAAAETAAACGHATRLGARLATRRRTLRRTRATDAQAAQRWFPRPLPQTRPSRTRQRFPHPPPPPPPHSRPPLHQHFRLHAACWRGSSSPSRRRATARTGSVSKCNRHTKPRKIGLKSSREIFKVAFPAIFCSTRRQCHAHVRHVRVPGLKQLAHGNARQEATRRAGHGCGRGWGWSEWWGIRGGAGWAPPERQR